jgi:hypothetical protein
MEIAMIALGLLGLAFAGITMRKAKPNVVAERVPAHPDTFELWNEGPGTAVIIHADVVAPNHPEGIPIDDAQLALPGLSVDSRIGRDSSPWAKGSPLEPLRRFEVRLPSATTLRIVYRAQGWLGSMATDTVVIKGRH